MSDWSQVDDLIVRDLAIPAIKEIRARTGCGLREAIEIFHERAAKLREAGSGGVRASGE